ELLALPAKLHLPVAFGYIRKDYRKNEDDRVAQNKREAREMVAIGHSLAFTQCVVAAEKYMREKAETKEVAGLYVENNTQTARTVKELHDLTRGGPQFRRFEVMHWSHSLQLGRDFLPLRKIVHAPSFQEKSDASLLQIADACALLIRFFLEQRRDVDQLVQAFTNNEGQKLGSLINMDSAVGFGLIDF
ncbi:MAG: hypothetical protein WAO00_08955, partial [Chthoniobacterales bacterium]